MRARPRRVHPDHRLQHCCCPACGAEHWRCDRCGARFLEYVTGECTPAPIYPPGRPDEHPW